MTGVVIHHTASPDVSVETIRKWHIERGFKDIGYHYVIRADGTREKGREGIGAHAKGWNHYIGIALTGDFEKHKPTEAQYKALAKLIVELDPDDIKLHKEVGNTACPGRFFVLPDYLKSWARKDIQFLIDNGIMKGYPDGSFRPKDNLSREEFAAAIRRLIEWLR